MASDAQTTTETEPRTGALSSRNLALAGWILAAALALVIYAPILRFMVEHWRSSEDYSHGFLIAPLAIYFAWERRRDLRRTPIEPSWWGLLPLALGTITLTIGRLGVELLNMRSSFVLTLIGLVLLLLGKQVFKVLAFPMLFLFLMIPLPQSLTNTIAFPLQLIAADFAVNALFLLEIPALREGNIIHLTNTQLFVAEACSGLRSLMALITLGVIFAYFFRKSVWQRLIIVASTIPIAILVNAFRVALTGVLTHYIGKDAASGWIHQTEGFFTFGIAFLLLLLEARLLERFWPGASPAEADRSNGMTKLVAALGFLALNFYVYHWFATTEVIPPRTTFAEFPMAIDSWACGEKGSIDPSMLRNLGATDYLICTYQDPTTAQIVDTYVGYHETQVRREGGGGGENSIHPPEHCLPGSGWDVIDARVVQLDLPGLPAERAEAKRFVIAKGNARQLVYFWYQSRGRVLARNQEVIFYRFWDRATRGRTDGSLVRITVPIGPGGEAEAERVFRRFAERFIAELPRYVPS